MKEITNKRRGGRPTKAIKREAATGVRFTKSEYFIVKQKAKKAGMKITVYVRTMAIEGYVKARPHPIDKQLEKQLVGVANNINQMTKLAHQKGLLTAMLFFEKVKEELYHILNRLRYDK
ncbi:MAG: plasmid mobilization relaxosome protein MobC [Sediminibacterium sp.]